MNGDEGESEFLGVTCPQSMYHPQCYFFHAASATWGCSGSGPTGNGSYASGAGGL